MIFIFLLLLFIYQIRYQRYIYIILSTKNENEKRDILDDIENTPDIIDEIMASIESKPDLGSPEETLDNLFEPIDIDAIDLEANAFSKTIATRLSGYYFDQEYIDKHPYIPIRIQMEMDNIRRLLKMLSITEKAQDILVKSISFSPTKGALFLSLDRMQSSTLHIQKQLNDLVGKLEDIFREMQEECEIKWQDKDKESLEDGTMTTRGSKEFIERLLADRNKYKQLQKEKSSEESKESTEEAS